VCGIKVAIKPNDYTDGCEMVDGVALAVDDELDDE